LWEKNPTIWKWNTSSNQQPKYLVIQLCLLYMYGIFSEERMYNIGEDLVKTEQLQV
jgi:hypothetical protein